LPDRRLAYTFYVLAVLMAIFVLWTSWHQKLADDRSQRIQVALEQIQSSESMCLTINRTRPTTTTAPSTTVP
jgi:hypothetical protein